MSDYKPNEIQNNGEDMEELLQLLERLKKREEVRRYVEQIAKEESELSNMTQEPARPARFQPTEQMAVDARDLLLTDIEEEPERPVRFQPTEQIAVDARDLLLADMEDPLQMSEYLLIDQENMDYDDEDGILPLSPQDKRNPFQALWLGFCGNFPRKEDSTGTKIRKYGFLTSLLVMLVALIYLLVSLVVIPHKNEKLKQELISLYHPEKSKVVITKEEAKKGNYPENMLASFTDLYDRNKEVRGWISFHATGEDFLDIEYPIVYSGDNEKYLKKDFDGNKNRNGTLFFDQNNKVNSYKDEDDKKQRSLIVYGHNMASGQMFAGLNKLMGNVNYARTAATFTMSTLFREDDYKVFAVVLIDESDKNERSYNMWQTSFANDAIFRNFIEGIQARSIFDYENAVDVNEKDKIVVLSTCTGKSSAHVKDGRLLVVARRVRDGENPKVNTAAIVKNTDVIMPYYWYINQNKPVHEYYTENGLDSGGVQLPTVSTQSTQKVPTTSTVPGQTTTTGTGTSSTDTTTTGTGSTDVTGSTDTTGSTNATGNPSQSGPSGSSGTSGTSGSSGTTSATQPTEPTKPTEPTCEHKYTDAITTPATCTAKGVKTFTCSLCKDSYTEEIPATGHKFSGICGTKCKNCEALREHEYTNDCDGTCNVEGCQNGTRDNDHKYEATGSKDPTCDKYGEIQYTCQACGNQHTEQSGEPTGEHTYGEEGVCTVCGKEKLAE